MNSPLSGIKVLDLSRILAGPWATQTLADLGADVVKVERPGQGDDTRSWGPPFAGAESEPSGPSAYFLSCNHGKKSIAIDIKTIEGQQLVKELADNADIVIENFKAGAMKRLNLDYAELSRRNPRLIYCSITGFGQTGPHAHRPGYDLLIQAMGGLMSITGSPDGPPTKVGVAVTDLLTGMYASTAILAALHERTHSQFGQYIDVSLFEVQIATLANQAYNYLMSGEIPMRHGSAHPNIVPYQPFEASNGHIVIAVGNDAQFKRLAEVIECPALSENSDYQTNSARVRNRDAVIGIIADKIKKGTVDEWVAKFDSAQIPAGPINTLDAVFNDDHVRQSQLMESVTSKWGDMATLNSPMHFSRTDTTARKLAPELGSNTDEILHEWLGRSAEEIELLRRDGII